MKSYLSKLGLVIVLIALAVLPGFAAPAAAPCTPGAVYDPACDANQNGVIDVLDIQLTAGHWTQSGLFPLDPYWTLTGNGSTTPGTHYVGTSDNQALQLRVNNSRALLIQPNANGSHNLVGGYNGNTVTAGVYGATIAGGGGSSFANTVTDHHGTVGGGRGNRAGDGDVTVTNNQFATVAGGSDNVASSSGATVGGGVGNDATGSNAMVGGGSLNTASGVEAVIAGGFNNTAAGQEATIAGGGSNDASSAFAVIGGGIQNIASGERSTIAGGSSNSTSAYAGAVGGGEANGASAQYATVPGGAYNTAAGWYSFAAGRRAKATHDGAFVWADSQNSDFSSTASDTFSVRALNGARIQANNGNFGGLVDNDGVGDGLRAYTASSQGNSWAAGYFNNSGTSPGIHANSGGTYAGYFLDQIFVTGGCTGCTLMYVAQNAGDVALQVGELVAAAGVADALAGTVDPLLRVQPSGPAAQGVVGVVFSRASVTPSEKEGEVLDSIQAAEGAVQPGDYLLIVVQGLAKVRVVKNETVIPGQRLKAGDVAGQASTLRSTLVNGLVVAEGVPVIGVVLDTPDPTSGLTPVMVTLR